MVDCTRDDIRDLLPDLVHDQLGPAERARVEQHLAECAECAAELKLLASLRAKVFATPELDVDRIAAAVRASMSASTAEGARDGASSGEPVSEDVVSIDEARRRLASGAGDARSAPRTQRDAGRTRRPSSGVGIPQSWRIAAVIALMAAGAGGYALTRGDGLHPRPMEQATVAVSEPAAPAAAPTAGAGRSEAKMAAPKPAAPLMASGAAGAAASDAGLATPPAGALILGDAVNELSESDMQALLQSVDDLEAMPDLEPHQLPLLASVVEGAL